LRAEKLQLGLPRGPLPDATARQHLIELYARGLEVEQVDYGSVVGRTEGMTASFFKELLRKAAPTAVAAERRAVTSADVDAALDELLDDTAALTRVLGSGPGGDPAAPSPHAWMERGAQASVQTIRSSQ